MSGGFFEEYLENIHLNAESVDWSKHNLTYLLKDNYAKTMQGWVSNAIPFDSQQLGPLQTYCDVAQPPDTFNTSDLVLVYKWGASDPKEYQGIVKQLPGVMDDIRGGRPRASYHGIVVVRCRGRRLFLGPREPLADSD